MIRNRNTTVLANAVTQSSRLFYILEFENLQPSAGLRLWQVKHDSE